ncbi:hypothetical protein JXA02_11325, partial [candidate division KSB1 bacterium]
MKRSYVIILGLVLFSALFYCAKETTLAPEITPVASDRSAAESAALEIMSQSGWTAAEEVVLPDGSLAKNAPQERATRGVVSFNRLPIRGNIVHYSFQVQTGPGRYDVIGLHRVVKEKRPLEPIKTRKNLFYQHGDCKDFAGMMLPGQLSPNMANDFGLAVFLAENDVDVWGIDQAWTLVPAEENDFSFMADWGMQRQVDDLEFAMSIARFIRLFTSGGFDQLILGGYSSGVSTGYALLNQETQVPVRNRNAGGFIAFDCVYKTDQQILKDGFAAEYNRTKALLDAGEYGDFVAFQLIAQLARTDPDGESPLFTGFTNKQAALFFAAGNLMGPFPFHYFGGFWENDLPVDLRFVTFDESLDFMAAGVPWEAARFIYDYSRIISDIEDVPFDDHLGQIRVPVLNISPSGGFFEATIYTTTLLGSSDITHVLPQLLSAEE